MGLSEDLQAVLAPLQGVFGVFARNLGTGETAAVNAKAILPTESAAKTFVLLHYCRQVATGECDPARRVVVPDDFRFHGTGVLRYLSGGLSLSLDDLAWLMIIVSDNVATALLLLEIGGPEAVNGTTADLGLPTARLATFDEMWAGAPFGTSSAHDLAEAYSRLDDAGRQKLARQQDLIGLPRRLDHNTYANEVGLSVPLRVFNKTGVGPRTFIDSGLFETDAARWVVAAMASEIPELATRPGDPVPVAFGDIGHLLYTAWGR
ncbi:MAG TPA: serine hydrolase [Acidimicrobiales bacterium]|nr:serine hydrolase [Acidimicrobiales bacterium]